ncbi:MAG: CBS domain-containing protein [Planctomycetes bacterium]|jgi:CBS domain-containing protein|nr:CBS domain-containing protein [Planctomycetota bacterium]
MQVSDVMTRNAECIRPDSTLQQAAERMRALDVGSLPVCEDDRLVGVLTDRDITVRCVADSHDPRRDTVRDAMTPYVYHCQEDNDVAEAAELMREKQVRRLPVLDHDHRLVGIIALGDLAVEEGGEPLAGHALEGISTPSSPIR